MSDTRSEELRRWRVETAADLERAQLELAVVQKRIADLRERLNLIDRLLAVEAGGNGDGVRVSLADPDDLLAACERIVRAAGRPLRIRELHAALVKEGVPLPGRGTEANVIVRLQRSNGRFIRTAHGTYAPVDFGLPESKPVRSRRVVRRKAGSRGQT
jgi:hypothetical protein